MGNFQGENAPRGLLQGLHFRLLRRANIHILLANESPDAPLSGLERNLGDACLAGAGIVASLTPGINHEEMARGFPALAPKFNTIKPEGTGN